VVDEGETGIDAPVPTETPPQVPAYHFHVAPEPRLPPFRPRVELPPEQIVAGVAVALVGAVEAVWMVNVAVLLSTEPQPLVTTQE
jgi:hypothetical protein